MFDDISRFATKDMSSTLRCRHESEQHHGSNAGYLPDTSPSPAFDDLTKLATHLCQVPIATITLINGDRQCLKSAIGIPITEVVKNISFSTYAIKGTEPFIVEDTIRDPLFSSSPFVLDEPHVRFYAGIPLITNKGRVLGALSVYDRKARTLDSSQLSLLKVLAGQVCKLCELDFHQQEFNRLPPGSLVTSTTCEHHVKPLENWEKLSRVGRWEMVVETGELYWSPEVYQIFGVHPSYFRGTFDAFFLYVHPDDRPSMMASQEKTLLSGRPLDLKHRVLKPDGRTIYVRERAELIHTSNSPHRRLSGTVQEIPGYEFTAPDSAISPSYGDAIDEPVVAHNCFRPLFESSPGLYLVLTPDEYRMVAASDARLRATMMQREDILGKKLFDVFPDDPADPDACGTKNLRASLERVKRTLAPAVMAVQRYPIPRPESEGGGFVERYWSPINSPVLNPDGTLAFIIHRVEDVTDYVLTQRQQECPSDAIVRVDENSDRNMEVDIVLRSMELKRLAEKLQESEQELISTQAELRELYERLQTTREEERLALAREVHDQLGQILSAAKIDIKLLEDDIRCPKAPLSRRKISAELRSARRNIDNAIQSVKKIATELRPPELENRGLHAAIEWHLRDFERRTRIKCNMEVNPGVHEPTGATSTALFRIFQETLTNILRHAKATHVLVNISQRGNIYLLRMRDNGVGIAKAKARGSQSMGLKGMRERAQLIGGRIQIGSLRSKGTLITIRIPTLRNGHVFSY